LTHRGSVLYEVSPHPLTPQMKRILTSRTTQPMGWVAFHIFA
jgi:hypothetical protein